MKKLAFILSLALLAFATPLLAQNTGVTSGGIYLYAGAPASGTTQVDTLTIGGTPSGGTFTIGATGYRTSPAITWSATNATLLANINTALRGLNYLGTSGITAAAGSLTAGIGTITLTFGGNLAKTSSVPNLTVVANNMTGTSPTAAITVTTAGVTATFRDAQPGAILVDTVTPGLYFNSSATRYSPTWTSK